MPDRVGNLERLLKPRSIAFVGGDDAAFSAAQCARLFDGPVWGVNPNRGDLGGVTCYPSVADLPAAPDATFVAVPRAAATAVVAALATRGAGGVACFTAGYSELGEAGRRAEADLVAAAGDLALLGPNCYGLVNFVSGAALWPFGAGRERCARGVALVMQSGMLPANLTMNERSLPISYVISAGNQAQLAIEDYVAHLLDDDAVTAFGIYIEGIRSVVKFAAVARTALERGKPLVVLKAGRSARAAELAISHTGSLAGADDAFDALFAEYGVIRVAAPAELVETLKFLSVSGAPRGRRIAAFTCSGGDALMVADRAQDLGLELEPPSASARAQLGSLLPDIATVSNPLDYTTPLWGNTEIMPKVFAAMIGDDYDAAVVIQDFPPAHIHDDPTLYRNDARSFAAACRATGVPGAACSDLPENIDRDTREMLLAEGITPLQGLDTGLAALAHACDYGAARDTLRAEARDFVPLPAIADGNDRVVDEWEGKQRLRPAGVDVPDGLRLGRDEFPLAALPLAGPLVLKLASADLAHKSDVGAVRVGLADVESLNAAMREIDKSVARLAPAVARDAFIVEAQVVDAFAELLVGVRRDPQFGLLLVLASGGVLVELLRDTRTLLLPTGRARVRAALESLGCYPLLTGFRGRPATNLDALAADIVRIAEFAVARGERLVEMDINPLLVTRTGGVVADVMLVEREIDPDRPGTD